MDQAIVPFLIDVPEAELTDLRRRLRQTRWPEPELVPDWSQGVPLAYLRDLVNEWISVGDPRSEIFLPVRCGVPPKCRSLPLESN